MHFSDKFFKTTGLCAAITGILVVILMLLQFGYAYPENLEEMIALQDNAVYTTIQWLYFATVFLSLVALWGVAAKKLKTAAGLAATGFIFILVDILNELNVVSTEIFSFNYTWAAKYAAETDGAIKSSLMSHMSYFYDTYGAVMFVGLIGFLVGTFLFGLATARGTGIEKIVSLFFFLTFIAVILWAVSMYWAVGWLMGIMYWILPIVMALLFFAIGSWPWCRTVEE